ncbi:Crp/Fnr family transcriptional regulator [Candidatus Albibeggiatoa sp. nov. BB20]|uniref:Crp/Fnr family transcriptional regulator n=1 Tax=Candidatus Albibeggiatoa sp. nov. BB20 TaxID=3162723 RepID=UPI0033654AA3
MIQAELQAKPLFSSLNHQQLSQLCAATTTIQLSAHSHLFHQGEQAQYFFVVRTGQVKLYLVSASGQEKIIEIIQTGQTFAEAIMFMQQATIYPVNAETLQDTELLRIPNHLFLQILRDSPDTCFSVMGNLSRRLHGLITEIDNLSLQNATYRVVHFLTQQLPPEVNVEQHIVLPVSKQTLALRLSITPETFSRILKNLTQADILSVKGKNLTIHQPQQLRNYGMNEI